MTILESTQPAASSEPRFERPTPARTSPDRSWTPRKPAEEEATAGDPSQQDADAQANRARKTISEAYRVIDDYVRYGQQVAQSVWMPDDDAHTNPNEQLPERFMRAMGDMTEAWLQMMQQLVGRPEAPRNPTPTGTAGPFSTERPAPTGGPSVAAPKVHPTPHQDTVVSVKVDSPGRVEVNVHLFGALGTTGLVVTPLAAAQGEGPPLTHVSLTHPGEHQAEVYVRIPDAQPPGTYNGMVLEAGSHRPRGTVSVTVH